MERAWLANLSHPLPWAGGWGEGTSNMTNDIPEGYKPLKRGGGYLTSLGPWYYRID